MTMTLTLVSPWWGGWMYQIVSRVTSDGGMPSTYLFIIIINIIVIIISLSLLLYRHFTSFLDTETSQVVQIYIKEKHKHLQNHCCWWPGDTRSQGFSSNGFDLICLEYSTRRFKKDIYIYKYNTCVYISGNKEWHLVAITWTTIPFSDYYPRIIFKSQKLI